MLDLSPQSWEALQPYPWPGNVRELQNCIERAVILCETVEVQPRHPNLFSESDGGGHVLPNPWNLLNLSGTLEEASVRIHGEFERHKLAMVLREVNGDRELAATGLRISQPDLLAKLEQHRFGP